MKKVKKAFNEKKNNLAKTLRDQADKKNNIECDVILTELNEASLNGEYVKNIQLKLNQAHYFEKLGLCVIKLEKIGYYEISWK